MRILTDFPGASIGPLEQREPGVWVGSTRHWSDPDGLHDQRYWFRFRLEEATPGPLTFVLCDMDGRYRGTPHRIFSDEVRPVISEDGGASWRRADSSSWDGSTATFRFTFTLRCQTAEIAYAHPYDSSRLDALLSRLKVLPHTEISVMGRSLNGLRLPCIQLSEAPKGPGHPRIAVLGLLHAGEDCSCWFIEGMIHALIENTPMAIHARRAAVWSFAPRMNPGGASLGIARLTSAFRDANAFWDQPDRDLHDLPEITAARSWLKRILPDPSTSTVLDVHSWSQFTPGHGIHCLDESLERTFLAGMRAADRGDWVCHRFARHGTCSWWSRTQMGVARSATVELSQGRTHASGRYLEPQDYLELGRQAVQTLTAEISGSGAE